MSWVLVNKDVSVALTGGSNPLNLEETCKAVEIYKTKLSPEILKKIELLLDNKPAAEMDVKTFSAFPSRRWVIKINNLYCKEINCWVFINNNEMM